MSTAFSVLNGAALNHVALGAALAVAGGGPTAMVPDAAIANVGAAAVPAHLVAALPTVLNRWNIDRSEANRRVYVDAYLNAVLRQWNANIPFALMVTCEENIGMSAARYGHGRLDYLLSALMGVVIPLWSPALIIEAKLNLNHGGAATNYGEHQLIGEIVTVRQLGVAAGQAPGQVFLRGILTDGRFWRFYEINAVTGQIQRSHALDTTNAGQRITVVRNLRKFVIGYSAAVSLWI